MSHHPLGDVLSSMLPCSLSCLWLVLLAGNLVLDLLNLGDLGDLLLLGALSMGDTEPLMDDTGEILVVVLLLSGSCSCLHERRRV